MNCLLLSIFDLEVSLPYQYRVYCFCYSTFQKPCHAPFWKKKKSLVNNFFPGESGKLQALLLCACCASTVLCYGLMSKIPALNLPPAYQDNSNGASVEVPAISQSLGSMFELLLTLIHPSKHVHTPNWKTKNIKPNLENKGPYDISINIG